MTCLVMGVVNVTPDSFSDGGRFTAPADALDHGLKLADDGADWLDIGGESTRPGAQPVGEAEELDRVLSLIEGLAARTAVPVSIDTMKPAVAAAAVAAGARMWNDISALAGPGAPALAASLPADIVLMHMQGEPRTMQESPHYQDVALEVETFLLGRARAAEAAGVAPDRLWIDPGIGFGKSPDHNLALVRALPRLASHGYRLLFGASRKRFIAALDPARPAAGERLGGSLALALAAARNGAAMVRVHDVRETVQALKVQAALTAGQQS